MTTRFYKIKPEIRILGLDDGPFKRGDRSVLVVGAVFRGGSVLDGVVSTKVRVDGLDATRKISELAKKTRFKDLRVIMLDGLAFGGFNMIDIREVNERTGLPVIAVTRDMPDFKDIDNALNHLSHKNRRWQCIVKAGTPTRAETKNGRAVYIQHAGLRAEDASAIVKLSATRSNIPEPIRAAHLIAQGIVLGESKGKA
ncbi:MAG: DUF99 family protein [Candidatus Altiarchaeota archaeon]|nr:DUF99 family protein [Candidatus Altiarchaeota archaeon]